ncbi:MFS transporter [Pantoea agglomerans]|uniref:MFS transporter n=1 Tax=Enterobacter agglomerans TaxID=549 RepID=UPI0030C82E02
MTPHASLITVPISMASLGTVIVMFPASLWMSRTGRKTGFITGTLSGIVAAVISILAMVQQSFMLLCLGMFFLGIYQAFAQFYRFAAGEVALPAFRTKAISLVLAGGVIAALLGPFLASRGSTLFSVAYVGSFLFMGILASLGLLLLSRLHMPVQQDDLSEQALIRPWVKVISQPAYLVALFSGASGFGIMVLGLTATPIAMKHYGFGLPQIAAVIQLHILGRFVPSFFTGKLIDRFGVINIMLAGILLLLAYIALVLSGTTWVFFASALVLMGIGWNFLYIGGTSLLATTYSAREKGVAQAANDMSVFIFSLICSLGAGPLLNTFGWETMHLILLPWIIGLVVPMFLLTWHRKRTTGPALK